jgi:predicted RNA-binding Zn-ribbon protein involved in translation (DUF1610 family)
MSLSQASAARTPEPLPCPECGAVRLTRVVENCRLDDGLVVARLRHYKCQACGARLFDDDAMHRVQASRASRAARATRVKGKGTPKTRSIFAAN